MTVRFVFVAAAFLMTGCFAMPRWHIVHEARPNPFQQRSSFHLAKVTFEGLFIGKSREWEFRSAPPDVERERILDHLEAVQDGIARGFDSAKGQLAMSRSSAGAHVVHVNVGFIDPLQKQGKHLWWTVVHADVKVLDAQSRIIDEFVLRGITPYRASKSPHDMVAFAATEIGELTAIYLNERTGLKASR